jgi:nucleoside-diphosphate-sugar epimerase
MWRPLLSVQDAAAAYQLMLQAPADKVGGEIFNVPNVQLTRWWTSAC